MRLIDADRLTHDLTDWQMELYSDRGHEKEFDILDKVINGISTMPTEVTVVRCKDCKHFLPFKGVRAKVNTDKSGWCDTNDDSVRADDYCSYGERNEE